MEFDVFPAIKSNGVLLGENHNGQNYYWYVIQPWEYCYLPKKLVGDHGCSRVLRKVISYGDIALTS